MDNPAASTTALPRAAGILMHITSLPSPFGTGDLGPEAFAFADFLHRSHQSYWQLLPLNPTTASQGNSPYSAYSSMAGNPLLISPEKLKEQGLLDARELTTVPVTDTLDYNKAWMLKRKILDTAFRNYLQHQPSTFQQMFEEFNAKESYWLDDFALYAVLRNQHNEKPWHQWPAPYKHREAQALQQFAEKNQQEITQCKWEQMIFHQQWHALKDYCNRLAITLFGDLPFYVGQDSADVWAQRQIFMITEDGELTGVAGVPPDAFSDTGQRWGMPVFKWDVLQQQQYRWWIDRLKKNMEFFDLLRLDHFRAFASYWEVPPAEETAVNGQWKKGPGITFFKAVEHELGALQFVAEDLGKIDRGVLDLRDALGLPGMNVLHFAFGKNMPYNDYITHHNRPHSVTYTGTHDNNTTKGWFEALTALERKNLSEYLDLKIDASNVCRKLNRLAYSSVAHTTILPIQDVLELGAEARMNEPGSAGQHWNWRLDKSQLTTGVENALRAWCYTFDRSPSTRKEFEANNPEEDLKKN